MSRYASVKALSPSCPLHFEILKALYYHHAHTTDQLTALFFEQKYKSWDTAASVCRATLRNKLAAGGHIERIPGTGQWGNTGYWHLTRGGMKQLLDALPDEHGHERRSNKPGHPWHLKATNDVCVQLMRASRASADHVFTPLDWRVQVPILLDKRNRVVPDAFYVYEIGSMRYLRLLEVDMGSEGILAWTNKVNQYKRLFETQAWSQILPGKPKLAVVCGGSGNPKNRCKRIVDEIEELKPNFAASVALLEDAIREPHGDIWTWVGADQGSVFDDGTCQVK